jgi:hypothetical protein
MPQCPLVFLSNAAARERLRFARAGMIRGYTGPAPGMLVRGPVHGMQGPLERQWCKAFPSPAHPRSGPTKLLGTLSYRPSPLPLSLEGRGNKGEGAYLSKRSRGDRALSEAEGECIRRGLWLPAFAGKEKVPRRRHEPKEVLPFFFLLHQQCVLRAFAVRSFRSLMDGVILPRRRPIKVLHTRLGLPGSAVPCSGGRGAKRASR